MPRKDSLPTPPDRLAAILAEVEAARRTPGWLPDEDDVFDRRSPLRRKRSSPPADVEDESEPEPPLSILPATRAARRRGEPEATIRPHEPLVREREPWWRTPSALRESRIAPSAAAVLGAVAVALVVAAVLAGRVLWARADSHATPVAASTSAASGMPSASRSGSGGSALNTAATGATAPGGAAPGSSGVAGGAGGGSGVGGGSGAAGGGAPGASNTVVVVDVVGQVRRPGIVRLSGGARVYDAIQAAGGVLPGANLAAVNMARVVQDGEQIQIPKPGEQVTPPAAGSGSGGAANGVDGSGGAGGSGAGGTASGPVNINTADANALDALPGVGPVLASRIVQWRTAHGRFSSVDELGEVSGIGDKLLEQLRPLVVV